MSAALGRHELRYGAHPSQVAELFVPQGQERVPVCVGVHGGFWRQRYGSDQFVPIALDLASHGVATLNLEYRRVGGGGGWPTTCHDVAAGVDALAAVPEALAARLDLTRVVGLGHSAGGHLVGWLAGSAIAGCG